MDSRGQIENTLALYAWTFDMDELDRIGECFTADAEVTFRTGLRVGRDAVVAELERIREPFRRDALLPWHTMTNVLVTARTDQAAEVTSFGTVFTQPLVGEGVRPTPHRLAFYEDRFVLDDGVWRIARRTVASDGRRPSL